MDPIAWAAVLLGLGLLFVALEFLIPSSGIIGVLALIAIIAGITIAFVQRGPAIGFLFVLITVISVPAILIGGFQILPHTPIGKLLISEKPNADEVLSDIATRRHLRDCIGWIGRSVSPMLPNGSIEIEGQLLDAISQGMPIEANTPVKIVDVQGTRIIVRPCRPEELAAVQPQQGTSITTDNDQVAAANDLFAQPLESLGIESWEVTSPRPPDPPSDLTPTNNPQ